MDGGRWSPGIWQNHHLTVKTITKNPIHPTFVRLFTLVINRSLFTFIETLKFKNHFCIYILYKYISYIYWYIISGFGIGFKESSFAFGCPFTTQIVFLKRRTWKHLSYGSPVVKNGKLFDKSPKFNMSNREVKQLKFVNNSMKKICNLICIRIPWFHIAPSPPSKKKKQIAQTLKEYQDGTPHETSRNNPFTNLLRFCFFWFLGWIFWGREGSFWDIYLPHVFGSTFWNPSWYPIACLWPQASELVAWAIFFLGEDP